MSWAPAWPTVEPLLRAAQPARFRWPRPGESGWIGPLHSPLRADENPSFSVRPDSESSPGAWKDFATGEHGSMCGLARRLGIDPRTADIVPAGAPSAEPESTLEEFCRRRRLDRGILEQEWNVKKVKHKGRPALRFPTSCGVDRIKFLDGRKPKAGWAGRGGKQHWYGLPGALKLDPQELVLVNGEPAAWAGQQSGVPTVCTCTGEGAPPTPEMVEELRQSGIKRVRVAYDHDEAGHRGARAAVEAFHGGGLEAVALVLPGGLGLGADLDDLHRRVGDGGLGEVLAGLPELEAGTQVEAAQDAWPELGELPPATPSVPHLPAELLPDAVRPYLCDAAERASLPLEMIAVPWLVVTSSVVGRGVGIHPELMAEWIVVPNLWGGIVAPPGALKTHAVAAATCLLSSLIDEAEREYKEEEAAAEIERARLEQALKRLTTGKGAATADPVEIAELRRELKELKPSERRYMTSDATVEKLGEILRDNPQGVLLQRDELAGWLRTLDRPGREGDREFWLESWNGTGGFVVDRIARGTIDIRGLCVSVVGGVQPGKLSAYVTQAVGNGAGADGLLQRLQVLVWPDSLGEFRRPTARPDGAARRRCVEVMEKLAHIDPEAVGAVRGEFDDVPAVRWSDDAQRLWDQWRAELEGRLRGRDLEGSPAFEAYVSKQRSLMPSIALVLNLVDRVTGAAPAGDDGVTLESAKRAAAWVEFLERHARKIYAVELAPGHQAAHALARRIKVGDIRHGTTVRDVCRRHWSGLRQAQVWSGLEVLANAGWVRVNQVTTGGRPSETIELHPQLQGAR